MWLPVNAADVADYMGVDGNVPGGKEGQGAGLRYGHRSSGVRVSGPVCLSQALPPFATLRPMPTHIMPVPDVNDGSVPVVAQFGLSPHEHEVCASAHGRAAILFS